MQMFFLQTYSKVKNQNKFQQKVQKELVNQLRCS